MRDRVVRNLGEMKSFPQCKTVGWIVSFKIKAVYLSEEVLVTDGNPKKQGEEESVPQATLSQIAIDSFREQLSQKNSWREPDW